MTVQFKCKPIRCMYKSDISSIYATEFIEGDEVKENSYGNVTILGEMHDLTLNSVIYTVVAEERNNESFGYQYIVKSISRPNIESIEDARDFLLEVVSEKQADSLLSKYPDIIKMIIENKTNDIDLSKIKYVKEKTFNKIKDKVIQNFDAIDLVRIFENAITMNIARKLLTRHNSKERVIELMESNPYKTLCEIRGIGFKKADPIILELSRAMKQSVDPKVKIDENINSSKFRLSEFIGYLLNENEVNSGNTIMLVDTLKGKVESQMPICLKHFDDVLSDDKFKVYINNKIITLKDRYNKELYIWDKIYNSKICNTEFNPSDYEKYRDIGEYKATNKQFSIFEKIQNYSISVLCGYSGSGKSASTEMVINMIKDKNKSFAIFAPTGKASRVIAGYTNEDASTIHRGLGFNPQSGWAYDEYNKLEVDYVITDEFSMADIDLAYQLFCAIDFTRTKLLIVGDPEQLPSVGAGNLLHEMVKSDFVSKVMLDEIFRYGIGGITTVATYLRTGKKYLKKEAKMQIFGEDKGYVFIPSSQNKLLANTVGLYKKLLTKESTDDILLLSPFNKGDYGTIMLNKIIKPLANPDFKYKESIKMGDKVFHVNDKVIQTKNDYRAMTLDDYNNGVSRKDCCGFVSNGDTGFIKDIKDDKIFIDFEDISVVYTTSNLTSIELGYAISVHKSQGSQSKIVIMVTDKSHSFSLDANLMYVAETRAKKRVYHLGDINTVNRKIKTKANRNRKTNYPYIINLLKKSKGEIK